MRLDPYLHGVHCKKEQVDNCFLSLNVPVLAETSEVEELIVDLLKLKIHKLKNLILRLNLKLVSSPYKSFYSIYTFTSFLQSLLRKLSLHLMNSLK